MDFFDAMREAWNGKMVEARIGLKGNYIHRVGEDLIYSRNGCVVITNECNVGKEWRIRVPRVDWRDAFQAMLDGKKIAKVRCETFYCFMIDGVIRDIDENRYVLSRADFESKWVILDD